VPLHILARQAIIVLDGDRHVADALDAIPPRSLPRPDTPPTGTVSSLGAAQSDNPPDASDMMPPDASRSIPTSNRRRWTGADRARGQRGPFAGRGLIARSWVARRRRVRPCARALARSGGSRAPWARPADDPRAFCSANVSSRQDWPSAAMHTRVAAHAVDHVEPRRLPRLRRMARDGVAQKSTANRAERNEKRFSRSAGAQSTAWGAPKPYALAIPGRARRTSAEGGTPSTANSTT
jgi:hypothetical protein